MEALRDPALVEESRAEMRRNRDELRNQQLDRFYRTYGEIIESVDIEIVPGPFRFGGRGKVRTVEHTDASDGLKECIELLADRMYSIGRAAGRGEMTGCVTEDSDQLHVETIEKVNKLAMSDRADDMDTIADSVAILLPNSDLDANNEIDRNVLASRGIYVALDAYKSNRGFFDDPVGFAK